MRYLVVVQVLEALEDLPRVEADGGLVVLQRTPFGPQQCRQTPCTRAQDKTQRASLLLTQQVHLRHELTPPTHPPRAQLLLTHPDESEQHLTSRHLLHEDLDEAVLADGAQVLHDVLVLQVLVQSDLLVERLRVPVTPPPRKTRR